MSTKSRPRVVFSDNISVAWARAFLAAISPRRELVPLVVRVTKLDERSSWEDPVIRNLLDDALQRRGKQSCNTVANTIFPESLWNPESDRRQLYERYSRIWPRIKKCKKNKYGVYFERLIAYGLRGENSSSSDRCNQLDQILDVYKKGFRRTVLQASIFDPSRDHRRRRYLHFPCLQHVTFAPFGEDKDMAVNGFYAMQYLFERAYGNYLGLCRLGRFVAHELGLQLSQMTCTVGIGQLEVPNCALEVLPDKLRRRLNELDQERL